MKSLLLVMCLLISLPGVAGAEGSGNEAVKEKPCLNCSEEHRDHHRVMHKDWQAEQAEREKKLLAWVAQYTPDKKQEWTKVIEERKQLRNQWLSPENAPKREKWKAEKMAKMKELRKQLEAGKITKEEFIKQLHGGKGKEEWKSFHDLRQAVEKQDSEQVVVILNQLLVQYKEHNQLLKEKLN
ncbi:hypothetical protein [Neobacillus dielmonensis]|uniref:hypothetical protein n=1 Tax=Neobacillus dielmonensis TaxID=1347369 RepID=UPI000694D45C|nr:hypothetical protein [Neobacillus dielmonensis]